MPNRSKANTKASSLSNKQISELTEEYKRAVEREWSVLRVGEAEISLKDVYVMLQAIASPPPKELEKRTELAEIPKRMDHAGIEPKESTSVPVQLSQALNEAQYLVLLGEPGSGKSTTLQFIGLCFVHEGWAQDRFQLIEDRIPIKLDLRGYADILSEPGPAMEQALNHAVREFLRDLSDGNTRELVQAWRDQGKLIVLLDGFDEVTYQQKDAVRNEIQQFASGIVNKQCRLIMSSRLAGYVSVGRPVKEFILKPFEHSNEILPYLESWLAVFNRAWKQEELQIEAVNLYEQMDTQPALHRVLDNPLLLRIAAQVYIKNKQIPSTRAKLYDEYAKNLWERAVERGADRAQKDVVWNCIDDLAWELQTGKPSSVSMEMIIILREKMGLIVEIDQRLAFSHTTLQEYFIAKRLKRAWNENPLGAWAFLRPRLHISSWREPILLFCGSLDAKNAVRLISKVRSARSPYESYLHRDILLMASLIGENLGAATAITRNEIRHLLLIAIKESLKELPPIAFNTLGNIKSSKLLRELIRALKNKDWGLRNIAVELLIKMNATESVPELIQALKDKNPNVRESTVEALRELKVAEAVPQLIQALKDEDRDVRRSAVWALEKMVVITAVPELIQTLKDEDSYVRRSAVEALGEMKATESVLELIQALKDKDWNVRRSAVEALGKMKATEAVPQLIQALKDEDSNVCEATVEALRELKVAEAIPQLIQALKDEDRYVRSFAVRALETMMATEAVPQLIQALKDEYTYVRSFAVRALGTMMAAEAVPQLIQALKDKDSVVRSAAVSVLGGMKVTEAVPELLQALKDEDWNVREAAIGALKERDVAEAVSVLVQALRDEDRDVRRSAVWTLGKMKATESVPQLIHALRDEERDVRRSAVEGLGKMKAIEAVPELIHALKDEDSVVRSLVVHTLREIKSLEAVRGLIQALKDESNHVFNSAADAVGEMKVTEAVPELIQVLNKGEEGYYAKFEAAAKALGEMKASEAVPLLVRALPKNTWLVWRALKEIIIFSPIPFEKEEQRKQIAILYRMMRNKHSYQDDLYIAERIAILMVDSSTCKDPFESVKPSVTRKAFNVVAYIILAIIVSGLLAVVATVSGAAQDIVKKNIIQILYAWSFAQQVTALFVIFFGLTAVGWFLTLLLERLGKVFGSKK